ncbi:TonB family protein [Paraburkholderia phenazinium]|uniref:TolA protein n=1 Tax=Paraburkholderia phenazinium TaxID=60549 RepID=A0A1G8JFN8_9BURK|nr:TonB family protein [Paraburkholderia phenazinium]SDI29470.1 TolA protein [Paraburkholderia phenazinium]
MHPFPGWNLQPRIHAAKALLILACILGTATARANITSAPSYVPAQSIPCSYGLSTDDLKSAGPALERVPRADVAVRVSIDASGQISDAVVEQSSGNPVFDNLALQASRRADCRPFSGTDGKPVAVETNFVFNLPRLIVNQTRADQGEAAAASNPAAAGSVHPPSFPVGAASPPLLAAALPFEFGKPVDTTALARVGILPGSTKAKLLEDWAKNVASDPDIKNYFSSDNNPATAGSFAVSRALGMLDGMARISREDRERLMDMTTRALDNAPLDCGGIKNLQLISKRYLSLGTQSDEEFRAQLQAMFDLVKQSTQSTPPPQITAGQRLQGQLALSASISDALKRDPGETEDLGVLMIGRQADLSPAAWCKATRIYRRAFDETPQPARDWVMLAELENQRRAASMLMNALKNLASMPHAPRQPVAAPKVLNYAEMVGRRIRPNIVWNGKVNSLETVVEVHCATSGNLESVKIARSSGDQAWDQAALEAVRRSDPMPLDENGQAPPSFMITLRPGD